MNGNATIKFNGQEVNLKFGFPQAKEFAMAISENVTAYFEGENITNIGIAKLIQTAYKNSCLLKEVKPSITLEQISDWLEENQDSEDFQKEIADVVRVWTESRYTKMWAEEVKKKTKEILDQLHQTPKKSTSRSKRRSTPTE